MSLACHKCGSKKTTIIKAKDLAKATNDPSVLTAGAGAINPTIILKIIEVLAEIFMKVFDWKQKSKEGNHNIILCEECGYWERL